MPLTLKQLRKGNISRIPTPILNGELIRLKARVERSQRVIEEIKPEIERLHAEAVDRNTRDVPHPYAWYDDPSRDLRNNIAGAETTIRKANKKIVLIEEELMDRILTGCE